LLSCGKNNNKKEQTRENNVKTKISTNKQQVILASSSETRKNQLKQFIDKFTVEKHKIDEQKYKREAIKPKELVAKLAQKKAESIKDLYPKGVIIGSDQILICDSRLIDKPTNLKEAKNNLMNLRNKMHILMSSIYVLNNGDFFFQKTKQAELFFKNINEKQIDSYLKDNEKTALSSVGSYRIEDNDQYKFLDIISGDRETILGFPIKDFMEKVSKNE